MRDKKPQRPRRPAPRFSEWNLNGAPVIDADARRRILVDVLAEIALWHLPELPDICDLGDVPYRRADEFDVPALIGPIAAGMVATMREDYVHENDRLFLGDIAPGYVAIRIGAFYVARMVLDDEDFSSGTAAIGQRHRSVLL